MFWILKEWIIFWISILVLVCPRQNGCHQMSRTILKSFIIRMTYFSPFHGVLYLYGGLRRAPQPYLGIFLEFLIIIFRPDSMKKCIFKTDRSGLVYYGGNLWKLWSNDQNLGSWWWSIQWLGSLGWRRPWSRRCPSSRWWRPECSSPGPFNHHDSIFMILDTWTRRAVPVFCWS